MNQEIHVLFIDDIWCQPEKRSIIRAEYGDLLHRDLPYVFHYEAAEIENGKYAAGPVLHHIKSISHLDVVILDIMFGDQSDRLGLDILEAIRKGYPVLPVIMMTSIERENLEVVERAMELGANEYIVKKPALEELETVLQIYTNQSSSQADFAIWGNSSAVRNLRADIVRVAASNSTSVLVTGESGTGKELVAQAIHRQSSRRNDPLIVVHSAALAASVLESELFGHERGAFTGAEIQRKGRFELANKGTLFLDEISEIDPAVQVKLLRVLEEKKFERVGGNETITVDIRLIAATNRNLAQLVEEGKFREDLFYRLNVVNIDTPPLRMRSEDISILANLFLERFKTCGGVYQVNSMSQSALSRLCQYNWPGNVRELRNVIERSAMFCRSDEIKVEHLPVEVATQKHINTNNTAARLACLPDETTKWAHRRVIIELILMKEALEKTGGNATLAVKYMFPLINSPNATYIKRYIKRLQDAPWGCSADKEISKMIQTILQLLGAK